MIQYYVLINLFIIAFFSNSFANDICFIVNGANIIAQDNKNTYLGKITNSYKSDSIFNEYGQYGSTYSSSSIYNNYSTFGSEYSSYSATNSYSNTPPMIIKNKKIIGYVTTNKFISTGISPILLKEVCGDKL